MEEVWRDFGWATGVTAVNGAVLIAVGLFAVVPDGSVFWGASLNIAVGVVVAAAFESGGLASEPDVIGLMPGTAVGVAKDEGGATVGLAAEPIAAGFANAGSSAKSGSEDSVCVVELDSVFCGGTGVEDCVGGETELGTDELSGGGVGGIARFDASEDGAVDCVAAGVGPCAAAGVTMIRFASSAARRTTTTYASLATLPMSRLP